MDSGGHRNHLSLTAVRWSALETPSLYWNKVKNMSPTLKHII